MMYLMIFAGALIAMLERFTSAQKKKDFSWNEFLNKNLAMFIFNIIAGCSIILAFLEGAKPIYWEGINLKFGIALIIGSNGHYVWKMLVNVFKIVFDKQLKKLENGSNDR